MTADKDEEKEQRTANSTCTQAGVSCFVGQESAIFEVQFFVGSSVVKTLPACSCKTLVAIEVKSELLMSKYYLIYIILLLIFSCSNIENKSEQGIDNQKYRNEKYFWWEESQNNGHWIENNDDGNWQPSTGIITQFYNNGKTKSKQTFVNGIENGSYLAWNINGNLLINGFLKNNRPDSSIKIYYPNGQVRVNCLLKDCLPYQVTVFSKSGVMIAKLNLSNVEKSSFLSGDQYLYYPNGKIKIKYTNNTRTLYTSNGDLIDQKHLEDISLLYTDIVFDLLKYYINKDNHPTPMKYPDGCVEGDCENGVGIFTDELGAKYTGTFQTGFLNGLGAILSINGDTLYSGQFLNGMFHGKGFYRGGIETYNGDYKYDLRNGFGELIYSDGSKYEGYFLNDKFEGQGIFTDSQGAEFSGIWKTGELIK